MRLYKHKSVYFNFTNKQCQVGGLHRRDEAANRNERTNQSDEGISADVLRRKRALPLRKYQLQNPHPAKVDKVNLTYSLVYFIINFQHISLIFYTVLIGKTCW